MKILTIKLSSLGDILHAWPVLQALGQQKPDWELHWLTKPSYAPLLQAQPELRAVHCWPEGFLAQIALLKNLRAERFDYILDLQGLLKTALIGKAIEAKTLVGLAPARERLAEILWSERVQTSPILDPDVHVIHRNQQILSLFGLSSAVSAKNFALPENLASSKFPLPREFIALAAGTRWPSKDWPKGHWVELASLLAARNYSLVLLGNESDTFEIPDALDLCGKTSLSELVFVLSRARAVIGSDSGILHLGDALGIRALGLFGPTSARRTGVRCGLNISLNLACSPCHKRICPLTEPAEQQSCLRLITASQIFASLEELLAQKCTEKDEF